MAANATLRVDITADPTEFVAAVRRCEHSLELTCQIRKLTGRFDSVTVALDRTARRRLVSQYRLRRARRRIAVRLCERRATLKALGNA